MKCLQDGFRMAIRNRMMMSRYRLAKEAKRNEMVIYKHPIKDIIIFTKEKKTNQIIKHCEIAKGCSQYIFSVVKVSS